MSKRIVVLGGAESGTGAAVLAKLQGFDVFLSDMSNIAPAFINTLNDYGIAFEQGQHTADLICNATEIIKSPGIPNKAPIIQQIIALQIPIISEIEFASRYTNAKMIAITGTNGKTTTTLLTYHLLKNAGLNVGLAGNVGNSFAMQVATKKFDYYVLELSSFMLDDMFDFKADIAILTNITPDHLDRYDYQMQKYVNSKFRITQNQTASDYFIYCKDDEVIQAALASQQIDSTMIPFSIAEDLAYGASISNQHLNIKLKQNTFTMTIQELALQGKHNLYNSMASGVAAKLLDIRNETLKESMSDFKNAPHRLESCGKWNGVEFINDSKATNVDAVYYALNSYKQPLILLMGGVDKGNEYDVLDPLVKQKVKGLICLGTDNAKLEAHFGGMVPQLFATNSLENAVSKAKEWATNGDVVLLSPACASFDLFKNYEDRGDQFKDTVNRLIHG